MDPVIFDPKDGSLRYRGNYVSAEVLVKAEHWSDIIDAIDRLEDSKGSLGDYDD